MAFQAEHVPDHSFSIELHSFSIELPYAAFLIIPTIGECSELYESVV